MKSNLFVYSLIAAMLIFGLVSCDAEEDNWEAGLGNVEQVSIENLDNSDEEGYINEYSFHSRDFHADVQHWPMVATGQTGCYGVDGEIPCPDFGQPFFGQDGSYRYGTRSYVDNANGTVTDAVTGVIWQKGYKADLTWYEAQSYCDMLTLSSYKWRLPLTHELKSLIDYGRSDPAIDITAFPDTPSEWFWAAKHSGLDDVASGKEASWIINFFDGFVEYTYRTNLYNVRCVKVN